MSVSIVLSWIVWLFLIGSLAIFLLSLWRRRQFLAVFKDLQDRVGKLSRTVEDNVRRQEEILRGKLGGRAPGDAHSVEPAHRKEFDILRGHEFDLNRLKEQLAITQEKSVFWRVVTRISSVVGLISFTYQVVQFFLNR
ncbi:MAG: hypothetical protein ACREC6_11910 [Hyphomicrobiaceae bacterium]